jgi:hypothetical protein
MKTISRMFAVACLSFAGLVGCAEDTVPNAGANSSEAALEPKVVRYGAADIAALKPGAFLRLDATLLDTVYIVDYSDPAILDRVIVVRHEDELVLGERVAATANDPSGAPKQAVVSGDLALATAYADPGQEATTRTAGGSENVGTAQQAQWRIICVDGWCCLFTSTGGYCGSP